MTGANGDRPGEVGTGSPVRPGDHRNADLFAGENGPDERAPSPFSGEAGGATERMREKLGRPVGARNKRDVDAEKWYFARGFVDPLQRLGELVSEDPRVLQAWLAEHAGRDADGNPRPAPTILDVVRMQIAAAGELMPYLHGKKPIRVDLGDQALPTLIIASGTNQLDQARELFARRALSIGQALREVVDEAEEKASETNGLEDGQ